MLASILFVLGVVFSCIVFWVSLTTRGEDKRGVVAFPFLLLLAAAIAHLMAV